MPEVYVSPDAYQSLMRLYVRMAVELERCGHPWYVSMLTRIREIQSCIPREERGNLFWAVEFALRAVLPTSRRRKAQCAQLAFLRVQMLLQDTPAI